MPWPVLSTLATALITATGWWQLCRTLPEPDTAEQKRAYASAGGWRPSALLGVLAAALMTWANTHVPAGQRWTWMVLATAGLWQAGLDAATTWIPKRLAHASWALLAAAIAATWCSSPLVAALQLVNAVAATAVFWLVWRISSAGFGFGDVRFVALPAAAAAGLIGGMGGCAALALGCVLTLARVLLDRSRTGQQRFMAWTPGLWLGAVLILATSS